MNVTDSLIRNISRGSIQGVHGRLYFNCNRFTDELNWQNGMQFEGKILSSENFERNNSQSNSNVRAFFFAIITTFFIVILSIAILKKVKRIILAKEQDFDIYMPKELQSIEHIYHYPYEYCEDEHIYEEIQ